MDYYHIFIVLYEIANACYTSRALLSEILVNGISLYTWRVECVDTVSLSHGVAQRSPRHDIIAFPWI